MVVLISFHLRMTEAAEIVLGLFFSRSVPEEDDNTVLSLSSGGSFVHRIWFLL